MLSLDILVAGCGGADQGDMGEASMDEPADTTPVHNTLTPEERAAGWELLFDGQTTDGWHAYGGEGFPSEGWGVDDGNLVIFEGGMGGDIVTDRTFSDFELTFDFKLSPQGNSGVFYRVREGLDPVLWHVAPEYQVLDDPSYIEQGITPKHLTADNYDLQAASVRPLRPVGEWNQGRILVDGDHVEHWLNGQLMVQYEFGSPEWEALVAESKFAPFEYFGRAREGSIGLQDHDHEIRYRDMKIRQIR